MKYKELAAFETNEFKIGDQVRVFIGNHVVETIIQSVKDEYVFFKPSSMGYDVAHFKQCRKLEPIKPREFWIGQGVVEIHNIKQKIINAIEFNPHPRNFKTSDGDMNWIKVREVLDDEE